MHHKKLSLVCADLNTVPHVPLERLEDDGCVIARRHLRRGILCRVVAVGLHQVNALLTLIIGGWGLTIALHECVLQRVEVDLGVRQDSELLPAAWIEGGCPKLAMLEGQFCHWGLNERLGLNVVDRDGEVWHAAHNQQVVAAAGEGHRCAAQGCLHCELGDDLLRGHLVDVTLGL